MQFIIHDRDDNNVEHFTSPEGLDALLSSEIVFGKLQGWHPTRMRDLRDARKAIAGEDWDALYERLRSSGIAAYIIDGTIIHPAIELRAHDMDDEEHADA
ncbi:MAG TPA: hypothetical protein PLQ54_09930 [Armatimonadota bacterium]|nr:hypothetical protein [Armatimonadota bacterium]